MRGQQISLDDLRFDQRRANREERLARENRRAFPHGEKIAGEAQLAQRIEKFRRDALELRQRLADSGSRSSVKCRFVQILDYLLQAGRQHEIAVARQVAEE